jgi:hypothetical protein
MLYLGGATVDAAVTRAALRTIDLQRYEGILR